MLAALCGLPLLCFGQEITEANYLRVDKAIWDEYERRTDSLTALYEHFPDKRDSLVAVYEQVSETASRRNREAALRYASVPSGLQRLFMVRLDLPKDTLRAVLSALSPEMQASLYGRSLWAHIRTHQVEEGDPCYDFSATDADGKDFHLKSLRGKTVLLLYGGLGCIGSEGREYLGRLYESTSRERFVIVVYWPCSGPEPLRQVRDQYGNDYPMVSDFLQDESPVKIRYGAQTTPTCLLIDPEGKVLRKFTGDSLQERLDEALAQGWL